MRLSSIASLALSGVLLSTAPESGAAQGAAAECVQEPNGESSMHRHCWDGGKRQGRWMVRLPGGEVREGSYVAGKKQGRWVIRLPDGGVQEGPYVAGEKQGRWVLRHADGTVEEGPVVAGLREGRWVAHRPDGSRRTFEMHGGALVAGSVRVVAQARGGSGERNAAALTRGDRRRIQSALAAQGFDPGPADGVFGPRTSRAIKAWQASNGYAATGVLTGEQAVALPVAAPLTPGGGGQPMRRTGGVSAPSPASDREPAASARLFAAHALSFRAAGLAGEHEAAKALAAMPGAGMVGDTESLSALWRPFFANAVVKLGRLRSSAPTALYYNPLLDVALLTLWERREGSYRVAAIRALSGERLVNAGADVPLSPPWTASEDGPVAALDRITNVRLEAFRQTHPAAVDEAGRDATTFDAAVADLRAALPRLVWSMAMLTLWAEGGSGWLEPALGAVDAALASRDAAAIRAAAPATDAATAEALASLPAAFADDLVLDMTLEASGDDRLMVASSPEDGHVYVLALCRLDGGGCPLHRLLLTSLLDE